MKSGGIWYNSKSAIMTALSEVERGNSWVVNTSEQKVSNIFQILNNFINGGL